MPLRGNILNPLGFRNREMVSSLYPSNNSSIYFSMAVVSISLIALTNNLSPLVALLLVLAFIVKQVNRIDFFGQN
tara:strand:- start:180 stop:404 length:225 start_codon:yes stop_codon:yes gene_type:complete